MMRHYNIYIYIFNISYPIIKIKRVVLKNWTAASQKRINFLVMATTNNVLLWSLQKLLLLFLLFVIIYWIQDLLHVLNSSSNGNLKYICIYIYCNAAININLYNCKGPVRDIKFSESSVLCSQTKIMICKFSSDWLVRKSLIRKTFWQVYLYNNLEGLTVFVHHWL